MDKNKLTPKSTQTSYSIFVFPESLAEKVILNCLKDEYFYSNIYLKNKHLTNPKYSLAYYHSQFINEPFNLHELYLVSPQSCDNKVFSKLPDIKSAFFDPNLKDINDLHDLYKENKNVCYDDVDVCAI